MVAEPVDAAGYESAAAKTVHRSLKDRRVG
jgi:hypothetical protein